jgi:hypothetical protein
MAIIKKKRTKPKFQETDLYAPVRGCFVDRGYEVRGEVDDCDLVAVREDDLVVVELKRGLTIELLLQATKRQSISESIYVAIPAPAKMGRRSRWPDMKRLIKRLEMGLIVVFLDGALPRAEIVFDPSPHKQKRSSKKRTSALREMAGRSGDYNSGGSTQKKLVTAYRESAIHIACYLDKFGPLAPKKLCEMGTSPKTRSILYRDVYGWFSRVEHGVYEVRNSGMREVKKHPELFQLYSGLASEIEMV